MGAVAERSPLQLPGLLRLFGPGVSAVPVVGEERQFQVKRDALLGSKL